MEDLLEKAKEIYNKTSERYKLAKEAFETHGGDVGSTQPPPLAARPFHRSYLNAQFVCMAASNLVQQMIRAENRENEPIIYELTCNRCGKTAKDGKTIGSHCGQILNGGRTFCSGQIIETVKSSQ